MGVIGTAIRLNQVPEQYKKLELKGRGATSIAYQSAEDANKIIMLTRDVMKVDWFNAIGFGKYIDNFETRGHHIPKIDELDVYVYELEKLYPLNKENKRIVKKAIEDFDWINISFSHIQNHDIRFQHTVNEFFKKHDEDHLLNPFIQFIQNYSPNQFCIDIGLRNFMQDSNGKIIVLDPVADKNLIETFIEERMKRQEIYRGYRG